MEFRKCGRATRVDLDKDATRDPGGRAERCLSVSVCMCVHEYSPSSTATAIGPEQRKKSEREYGETSRCGHGRAIASKSFAEDSLPSPESVKVGEEISQDSPSATRASDR